jgi:LysM repeat protein
MADKAYEAALSDYLVAVDLAERDDDVVLRLYEAYLRAGEAHAAQEAYEPAVLMYRKAVEVGDLQQRALENPSMAEALTKAEAAVTAGNFSLAYEQYHAAIYGVQGADATQATITHVVQRGEYLVLIATRYHSTVQAIVAANNIANPRLIYAGQELVIPVQP